MVDVIHTPGRQDQNRYAIVGDSIGDVVTECLRRIRPISQDFYRRELRRDLADSGQSLIDRHAGMGSVYTVYLTGAHDKLAWPYGG